LSKQPSAEINTGACNAEAEIQSKINDKVLLAKNARDSESGITWLDFIGRHWGNHSTSISF
jgi:hypothetical protein